MNFFNVNKYQILTLLTILFLYPQNIHAAVIDELRDEIFLRNREIKLLELDVEEYQKQIVIIGGQASTLNSAIRTLDITHRKLATDILITGGKVQKTTLTIDKLALEIGDKRKKIKQNTDTLSFAIRELNDLESRSLVEIIFSNDSFSSFWKNIENLERFQNSINDKLKELKIVKVELEDKKVQSENEKINLNDLNDRLTYQKTLVLNNKSKKAILLKVTKNKESNYKKLLGERLERKEALEKEIIEFEARLKVEIDPASLPPTGTGILHWPLGKEIKITQFFGNTPFASKNPQVYNGGGHNGIDFRASIGDPVTPASSGEVVDFGDTDTQCSNVSYGKWILIKHLNGLSTLYAHLDLISVTVGQKVNTDRIIGYSGNTGYTTGPHLHFGVFATQAVSVTEEYPSKICGTNLKLPVSPKNGYLNPLSYLPIK